MIAKLGGDLKGERVFKKQVKPEFQLLFELVNNVLLPRFERRSMTTVPDMFLMKNLASFTPVNLPSLIMKHMLKIMSVKDGKHGLCYGFILTKHQDGPGTSEAMKKKYAQLKTELADLRTQVRNLTGALLDRL
ncbi:hypothetical protein RND71_017778 [Anisodus tanguticus]|uniref:Uncharacterized protein n=1 Tax=Anisodus tanguticus TaxID=243964 RepID=A0AAE1S4E2_9SOLA|nr:hypothetical protein RND71_017778 [Anisodus tanguticus]